MAEVQCIQFTTHDQNLGPSTPGRRFQAWVVANPTKCSRAVSFAELRSGAAFSIDIEAGLAALSAMPAARNRQERDACTDGTRMKRNKIAQRKSARGKICRKNSKRAVERHSLAVYDGQNWLGSVEQRGEMFTAKTVRGKKDWRVRQLDGRGRRRVGDCGGGVMGVVKWYKRDPNAALTGMASLTLEERGAYNTILDLIYAHDGAINDNDRFLAGWCCVDVRVWKRIRERLIVEKKLYVNGSTLRNARADWVIDAARHKANRRQMQRLANTLSQGPFQDLLKGLAPASAERPHSESRIQIKEYLSSAIPPRARESGSDEGLTDEKAPRDRLG